MFAPKYGARDHPVMGIVPNRALCLSVSPSLGVLYVYYRRTYAKAVSGGEGKGRTCCAQALDLRRGYVAPDPSHLRPGLLRP